MLHHEAVFLSPSYHTIADYAITRFVLFPAIRYDTLMKYLPLFLLVLLLPAPAQARDLTCADFAGVREAQAYFDAQGWNMWRDPLNLDPDDDGQACEHWQYGTTGSVADDTADPRPGGGYVPAGSVLTGSTSSGVPFPVDQGGYTSPYEPAANDPYVPEYDAPSADERIEQRNAANDRYTKTVLTWVIGTVLALWLVGAVYVAFIPRKRTP